jgi:hypothetical protein
LVFTWIGLCLCQLHHKLIGFYNRDEKCLQRGTDWVFEQSGLRFVCKGLIHWTSGTFPVYADRSQVICIKKNKWNTYVLSNGLKISILILVTHLLIYMLVLSKFPEDDLKMIEICWDLSGLYVKMCILISYGLDRCVTCKTPPFK